MKTQYDPKKQLDELKIRGEAPLTSAANAVDNFLPTTSGQKTTEGYTDAMLEALEENGIDKDNNVVEGSATDKAMDLQNEGTEFTIQQINQQKEEAKKDYEKEKSSAYTEYQKYIDPYGTQAEQVAMNGLSNSGYAESLKTQAYVAYQNRATALRESYDSIIQDYNNQITSARLQNSAALSEIYSSAVAQRLQLLMEYSIYNTDGLYIKKDADTQQTYQSVSPVAQATYGTVHPQLSTYESVQQYLNERGIDSEGLLTQNQWEKGRKLGASGAEYQFPSYAAYLYAYALWRLEEYGHI